MNAQNQPAPSPRPVRILRYEPAQDAKKAWEALFQKPQSPNPETR